GARPRPRHNVACPLPHDELTASPNTTSFMIRPSWSAGSCHRRTKERPRAARRRAARAAHGMPRAHAVRGVLGHAATLAGVGRGTRLAVVPSMARKRILVTG